MPKLFFDIEARFASVQDGLSKIDRDMQKFGRGVESMAAGLRGAFDGIVSALSVGAIASFTKSMIASAAALDDMAEATGASVEGLSKLTDIARISGKDIGLVQSALVGLTKALAGSDDETRGAAEGFKALGLSVGELQKLSPDKALEQVVKALDRFADGSGKASIVLSIFKRTGAELAPLFKDIAEQMDRSASLTAEQAAQAERLEKSWGALITTISNTSRSWIIDSLEGWGKLIASVKQYGIVTGSLKAFNPDITAAMNEAQVRARIEKLQVDAATATEGKAQDQANSDLMAARMRLAEILREQQAAVADKPQAPFVKTGGGAGGGNQAAAQAMRANLAALEGVLAEQAAGYKGYYDTIDSLRRRDVLSEREALSAQAAAHVAELEDRRRVIEAQAGLAGGQADRAAGYQAKLAEIDAEILRTHAKYANDFLEIEARIDAARAESVNAAVAEIGTLQQALEAAREGNEELSARAAVAGLPYSERAMAEAEALTALKAARIDNNAALKDETADVLAALGANEELIEAYRQQATVLRDTADEVRRAGSLQKLVDHGKDDLAELKAAIDGWAKDATKAFVDFAFGAETSVRDMLKNIAKEFVSMQIQSKIMDPLFKALGDLLGGIKLFHGGGIVGAEGSSGTISPLAFAGAPRFHSGIGPDEVPAVLKRGEGVFTPGQMRALGGGQSVRVEIHNEGAPQKVISAQPSIDPTGIVVSIVTRDLAVNGPIAQSMGALMGARR